MKFLYDLVTVKNSVKNNATEKLGRLFAAVKFKSGDLPAVCTEKATRNWQVRFAYGYPCADFVMHFCRNMLMVYFGKGAFCFEGIWILRISSLRILSAGAWK